MKASNDNLLFPSSNGKSRSSRIGKMTDIDRRDGGKGDRGKTEFHGVWLKCCNCIYLASHEQLIAFDYKYGELSVSVRRVHRDVAMRRNRKAWAGARNIWRNAEVQECVLKWLVTLVIVEQIINRSKLIRKMRREALKPKALSEKLRHSLRYRFSLDVCTGNLITNVNTNYAKVVNYARRKSSGNRIWCNDAQIDYLSRTRSGNVWNWWLWVRGWG